MTRNRIYLLLFAAALAGAASVAAYNINGILTFGPIPPGKMSWLSFTGLNDLQRGQLTSEALKPQSLLAYLLLKTGLSQFGSLETSTVLFFAAIPIVAGIFAKLATKSLLVGGGSALLVSLFPFGYLAAVQGDYSLVSGIAMIFAALCPALLFLRGRGVPWLALSAVFAAIGGMSAVSVGSLLFLTCLAWASFSILEGEKERGLVILPGLFALAVALEIPRAAAEVILRQATLASSMPGYSTTLALIAFAGVVGGVAIGLKEKWGSVPVLTLVGSGTTLIAVFGWEGALLTLPVATTLVAAPLTEARRIYAVVPPSLVEVDVERTFAVGVSFLTLSSPILTGLGPGAAVQGFNYLGPEELMALNEVGSLSPSLFGQGLVAAPPSIAPWLRADLGVKTLVPLTDNQSAELDAITSTSFRLRSSYLSADDWTPMSSFWSPLVSAFDGLVYAPVLHLDDGQNRVNFTYGKQVLSEGMARMYMSGHYFAQNSLNISLSLQLASLAFNTTKELVLSKGGPALSISYTITPNPGYTLHSVSLPVFIEGEQKILTTISSDTLHLTMRSSNLSLSFPGGSPPQLIHGGQDYSDSTFKVTGGSIHATMRLTVESAKNSGQGLLYSSLLDELSQDGVSSLLTFTPPPGLNFLANTVVQPVSSLDVKDAFNRVLLVNGHTSYVETPGNAVVLSQNITDSCDATFTYKTAGLIIVKKLAESNNALSMSFKVTPWKENTTLREMNMSLWIPYDASVVNYGLEPGSLSLLLDSGRVDISATSGNLKGSEVGPDPVYGQTRVLLHFSLNPSGDTAGIMMKFGGKLSCQQLLGSRPVLNGSDELILSANHGLFSRVFSDSAVTVYRLTQANLNATP